MFLLMLLAIAQAATPKGWLIAGSDVASYEANSVSEAHTGRGSAQLRSVKTPKGFGTLMQSIAAQNYAGQRVRLTAWVKSESVGGWAGVWMRVDAPSESAVSFDNMQDRPIKGTTAWTKYSVVLDVPARSSNIAFGILVDGAGSVWLDDLAFEVVDESVPVTGASNKQYEPVNPSFEE